MPKRRSVRKIDNRVVKTNNPKKFRVGTRKSGTSALVMNTKVLLDLIKVKHKDHNNIVKVLMMREVV